MPCSQDSQASSFVLDSSDVYLSFRASHVIYHLSWIFYCFKRNITPESCFKIMQAGSGRASLCASIFCRGLV